MLFCLPVWVPIRSSSGALQELSFWKPYCGINSMQFSTAAFLSTTPSRCKDKLARSIYIYLYVHIYTCIPLCASACPPRMPLCAAATLVLTSCDLFVLVVFSTRLALLHCGPPFLLPRAVGCSCSLQRW
jgi:hypothetical protein